MANVDGNDPVVTWVREYADDRLKLYEAYAVFLKSVLSGLCTKRAAHAFVESRPKSIASFAEKTVRRGYTNPLEQMRDLCGARVILQTSADVSEIRDVIHGLFIVDPQFSEDKSATIEVDKFGYRSVHLSIQVPFDIATRMASYGLNAGDFVIPEQYASRTDGGLLFDGGYAEIQVRTLLEHVWADINHDRMYKAKFKRPAAWERETARLSALLESADDLFQSLVDRISNSTFGYGQFLEQEEMDKEIEIQSSVLAKLSTGQKLSTALHLAGLLKVQGKWGYMIETLKVCDNESKDVGGATQLTYLTEYGNALCQASLEKVMGSDYDHGLELLHRAVSSDAQLTGQSIETRLAHNRARMAYSQALMNRYYRSGRSSNSFELREKAQDYLNHAYQESPNDPFITSSMLEASIEKLTDSTTRSLLRPVLLATIEKCKTLISLGSETAASYLIMGRSYCLLDERRESLNAYAKAVRAARLLGNSASTAPFAAEVFFLKEYNFYSENPLTEIAAELLTLVDDLLSQPSDGQKLIEFAKDRQVLILAGGAASLKNEEYDRYCKILAESLQGYAGYIVSGGTRSGVSQIAADIRAGSSNVNADLIGYIPRSLPGIEGQLDPRYDNFGKTDGDYFSEIEPIAYWRDLLRSGVKPSTVRLLGIGGGSISAFEYRLALALGASAAVLTGSGGEAEKIAKDPDWNSANFLPIDDDPDIIRAYVWTAPKTDAQDGGALAQEIHAHYVKQNRRNPEPALQNWSHLNEDYKEANFGQASFAKQILSDNGFELSPFDSPLTDPDGPPVPDGYLDKIDQMARMEHARWVADRLEHGWRLGTVRDNEKKIHTDLVPWNDLSIEKQGYDITAVKDWVTIFAKAGLKIRQKSNASE